MYIDSLAASIRKKRLQKKLTQEKLSVPEKRVTVRSSLNFYTLVVRPFIGRTTKSLTIRQLPPYVSSNSLISVSEVF